MSPRFKGGSDDWLDDEKGQKFRKKKSSQSPDKKRKESAGDRKAAAIPWDEGTGFVTAIYPKQCRVLPDDAKDDSASFLCGYRRAEIFDRFKTERTPVAVGDRVKLEDQVVVAICERRNSLSRPAPGHELRGLGDRTLDHVIAANIDTLAIVVSAKNPEFSEGVVDRFIVAAKAEGIDPVLCVTKMDLVSADEKRDRWLLYGRELKMDVFELSSHVDETEVLAKLNARLMGRRVVFCGHSGVGKTSLLRRLTGQEIGKIGEVNAFTGKGRHTTTGAVLVFRENNSFWIDTPGVREFRLKLESPAELRQFYPDLEGVGCDFGCIHRDEENCKAKSCPRYLGYRRILESLFAGEG